MGSLVNRSQDRLVTPAETQARRAAQDLAYDRWFPPKLPKDPKKRTQALLRALLCFIREAVKTIDEHDTDNPIKPIPLDELPYLIVLFHALLSERIVFVRKSRQILVSLSVVSFVGWWVLYFRHQRCGLVPKKREDGDYHIETRMKLGFWDNLPPWLKARYTVAPIKGTFLVTHKGSEPWGSSYTAYPQGADQLRQHTHSLIVWEEAAFQEKFASAWQGAMPTIQARKGMGGKVVVISSVKKGSEFSKKCGAQRFEATRIARGFSPSERTSREVTGFATAGLD